MEHSPSRDRLVKIVLELERDAWHGHSTETLWANPAGADTAEVRSVPFFGYGISWGDVVDTKTKNGQLVVARVRRPAGHSTYRIFMTTGASFDSAWAPLGELGCTYERATEHHFAVDVPPESDIYRVYALLEAGKVSGHWDFEEGHCGHKLK